MALLSPIDAALLRIPPERMFETLLENLQKLGEDRICDIYTMGGLQIIEAEMEQAEKHAVAIGLIRTDERAEPGSIGSLRDLLLLGIPGMPQHLAAVIQEQSKVLKADSSLGLVRPPFTDIGTATKNAQDEEAAAKAREFNAELAKRTDFTEVMRTEQLKLQRAKVKSAQIKWGIAPSGI